MARRQRYTFHERLAWALLVLGTTCTCAPMRPSSQLPVVARLDTRDVTTWHMDSVSFRITHAMLLAAYPRETGFCLLGELTRKPDGDWRVDVDTVVAAPDIRATDETHVWYSTYESCLQYHNAVGIGHDHPVLGYKCAHSPEDAYRLFGAKHVLFSLVLCASGEAEVLWQDGRRSAFLWAWVVPRDSSP